MSSRLRASLATVAVEPEPESMVEVADRGEREEAGEVVEAELLSWSASLAASLAGVAGCCGWVCGGTRSSGEVFSGVGPIVDIFYFNYNK